MRSLLDDYLPAEARENNRAGRRWLTPDEVAGVRMKARIALQLPRGLRGPALERVGREYGITRRSVERYATSRTVEVIVDGWRGQFVIVCGRPQRKLTWSRE